MKYHQARREKLPQMAELAAGVATEAMGGGGRGNTLWAGTSGGSNSGAHGKSHIHCYNCDVMGHYSS